MGLGRPPGLQQAARQEPLRAEWVRRHEPDRGVPGQGLPDRLDGAGRVVVPGANHPQQQVRPRLPSRATCQALGGPGRLDPLRPLERRQGEQVQRLGMIGVEAQRLVQHVLGRDRLSRHVLHQAHDAVVLGLQIGGTEAVVDRPSLGKAAQPDRGPGQEPQRPRVILRGGQSLLRELERLTPPAPVVGRHPEGDRTRDEPGPGPPQARTDETHGQGRHRRSRPSPRGVHPTRGRHIACFPAPHPPQHQYAHRTGSTPTDPWPAAPIDAVRFDDSKSVHATGKVRIGGDCRIDTGIIVHRPEGAATSQPRATPWDRIGWRSLSPDRAKHRRARVPPCQGSRSPGRPGPRALPWAELSGPFGAEPPCPVSLL